MKKELQEKLFAKYPELFRQKPLGPFKSCMGRGIETNDGWEKILTELCEEMNQYKNYVEFAQIKEKLGRLTVYVDFINDPVKEIKEKVINITEKYLEYSKTICDVCGESGKLFSDHGWLKTRCESHNDYRE